MGVQRRHRARYEVRAHLRGVVDADVEAGLDPGADDERVVPRYEPHRLAQHLGERRDDGGDGRALKFAQLDPAQAQHPLHEHGVFVRAAPGAGRQTRKVEYLPSLHAA